MCVVAVQRVVVEVHLGVERDHAAVAGNDQWIDLDEARVGVDERLVERQHRRRRLRRLPAFETEAVGQPVGVEPSHAGGRIDAHAEDLLRRRRRHLLDLHAALGRGDDGDAARRPVEQHADVELAGDVAAFLDVDAADLPPLRPGLRRHESHAEHGLGRVGRRLDRLHDLDAAALAPAAGVDLRLDHPDGTAELARRVLGLGPRIGDAAARHRDAEVRQQRLGLVLVNVHARRRALNGRAAAPPESGARRPGPGGRGLRRAPQARACARRSCA